MATALFIYFLDAITFTNRPRRSPLGQSLESFFIISIVSIFAIVTIGLMAFCYLHLLWVKPSRHLLVGVQQVKLFPINFNWAVVI